MFFLVLRPYQQHKHKHKSYKPYKHFANNECEYEGGCRFSHKILQRGQPVCYKYGDILSSKTELIRHIRSEHGNEVCKKFKENDCDYGSKCLFQHINGIVRQAQAIPTQQDFQPLQAPAQPHRLVFQEHQTSQIPLNIMNMTPQIVSQIVIALTQQNSI